MIKSPSTVAQLSDSESRKNLSLLQKLHFETVHSGVLTATRVGSMIEMELPLNPPDTGNCHNAPRHHEGPFLLHSPSLYVPFSQSGGQTPP